MRQPLAERPGRRDGRARKPGDLPPIPPSSPRGKGFKDAISLSPTYLRALCSCVVARRASGHRHGNVERSRNRQRDRKSGRVRRLPAGSRDRGVPLDLRRRSDDDLAGRGRGRCRRVSRRRRRSQPAGRPARRIRLLRMGRRPAVGPRHRLRAGNADRLRRRARPGTALGGLEPAGPGGRFLERDDRQLRCSKRQLRRIRDPGTEDHAAATVGARARGLVPATQPARRRGLDLRGGADPGRQGQPQRRGHDGGGDRGAVRSRRPGI